MGASIYKWQHRAHGYNSPDVGEHLGFDCIVVSETEAPDMSAIPV
jgi:hypothetical protein